MTAFANHYKNEGEILFPEFLNYARSNVLIDNEISACCHGKIAFFLKKGIAARDFYFVAVPYCFENGLCFRIVYRSM